VAAGAGALGAGAHAALDLVGFNQIGFCGGTMSRRFRLPPLVIAVSGLTPLLPGLTTYRAMFELAVQRSNDGWPAPGWRVRCGHPAADWTEGDPAHVVLEPSWGRGNTHISLTSW
jgi:Threonine/Serine exporter, ThrE